MIHLTDAAQDQIIKLCHENRVIGVRMDIVSGGCSGYQYKFSLSALTAEDEDEDVIAGTTGAALFVRNADAEKINGATVDYYTDLTSERFEVHNPNSACCGCGKSFS